MTSFRKSDKPMNVVVVLPGVEVLRFELAAGAKVEIEQPTRRTRDPHDPRWARHVKSGPVRLIIKGNILSSKIELVSV